MKKSKNKLMTSMRQKDYLWTMFLKKGNKSIKNHSNQTMMTLKMTRRMIRISKIVNNNKMRKMSLNKNKLRHS